MHEWSLILLFAVCLAVEASNVISCGTVLNYSAPVIDIAAYDVDGSAQVNIEGCVWESANITLSFRRSIAVTVERVTLTRCSLVLAGTASASIPPGSKVSFVSVSASQCGDCCSVVTAEALSDFSLHVVDSVLSASRSAASIMSPAAVRCSISIIRSTIDVRSTTRAATSSGCFWSATSSMLNLSAVQLMVLSSKITTATTGQYSCCVGALSPNALEVRNADFRVSGSFLDATGGTSTLTNGAVVSVGFISVTKGALLESCTLTVHSSKITAALTGAAGGAVASVGAATSANYPLRVSSTSFLASFSTLSAAMTVPENENFFSAAALGFAAGRNSIEATAVRIQATASRISSEIGSNCETGTAAASMALVSRALLIAIDDCIITAIGCTVSAVGSAGDDAAAAAIGVASTGTASHLPVFSGNSMFAVNTTVIVSLQGVVMCSCRCPWLCVPLCRDQRFQHNTLLVQQFADSNHTSQPEGRCSSRRACIHPATACDLLPRCDFINQAVFFCQHSRKSTLTSWLHPLQVLRQIAGLTLFILPSMRVAALL